MIKTPTIAAFAILLLGGQAVGQQQHDSLGSPTPAPHQNVSPAPNPSVPVPGNKPAANAPATPGTAATDGTGAAKESPAEAKQRSERESYGPPGGPPDNGTTPSGLTPD